MRGKLLTAVVFSVGFASPALADTFYVDGSALFERCSPDQNDLSPDVLIGNCLGYVAGAVDTLEIHQSVGNLPRYYCLPERVSVNQLVAVVVKYLGENPAELHNIASSLILKALVEAFPCE